MATRSPSPPPPPLLEPAPARRELADGLRRIRQLGHWTQAELATVLGVSLASVKFYEQERVEPRFGTIARFLEATGLPLGVFTGASVDWRAVERDLLTLRLRALEAEEPQLLGPAQATPVRLQPAGRSAHSSSGTDADSTAEPSNNARTTGKKSAHSLGLWFPVAA
jgi:transcriptional regulator with XRE-family HTH domain